MSSLTTGNITDQPCECEKCAGIRRHDVGLRSDNWIMTPESRQQQPDTPDSLESHSLCSAQQLGAPAHCKEPQWQNVSVTRKCNSHPALVTLVRSRVITQRRVTSRLTSERHEDCQGQDNSGRIFMGK